MKERGLTPEVVEDVVKNPQIVREEELGKFVYQAIREFENGKNYLVRVFVNVEKEPNQVITAYKTSQIEKYS